MIGGTPYALPLRTVSARLHGNKARPARRRREGWALCLDLEGTSLRGQRQVEGAGRQPYSLQAPGE